MIDTHSHIYLEQFNDDLHEVLDRAVEAGITEIFMPAIDRSSLDQMDRLPSGGILFRKMAGLHPADVTPENLIVAQELHELCSGQDIYGVGETGLDYYWSTDFKDLQKQSLRIHCEVARETGKPIILHNRESTHDLLQIIEEEQDGRLTGIWHCFNGSEDEGRKAIDLGLHLGIGGVLTFKNAGVDKTVAALPLDRMVLETDAPYLSPAPHRGKRNEPAYMKLTATRLAEIFGLSLSEIDEITSRTAQRLFRTE